MLLTENVTPDAGNAHYKMKMLLEVGALLYMIKI